MSFGKINLVENKRSRKCWKFLFWVKSQKKPVHSDRPRGGEPRGSKGHQLKREVQKVQKLSQSRRQRGFSP
jgi:hypothetical protein